MPHRTAHAYSHWVDVYVTVKLCIVCLIGNIKSLHHSPSPRISQPQAISHLELSDLCSVVVVHLCRCHTSLSVCFIIWLRRSIIHSSPSLPWSLCLFLFPPQRFIHPSEHAVLSIPFIGMIVIVAVVWCWLSELASQRARYGRSLYLSEA